MSEVTHNENIPDDPLTGHSYDGIQEFDNPLPGWWQMIFVGSILFSVLYWLYYHNGSVDRSIHNAYDIGVAENLELQFAEMGELQPDAQTILANAEMPDRLAGGKNVYDTHCVSCHGKNAQGKVGPNLTDNLWKHVKKVEDIARVVANGANGKAMPAWKTRLHPNHIVLVSAYIASLRGSSPDGSGTTIAGEVEIPPWTAADEPVAEPEKPADQSNEEATTTEPRT